MAPTRIQRRRTAGHRHPEGTVYVTRAGKGPDGNDRNPWSNPYPVEVHGRAQAVALFRLYAANRAASDPGWLAPLRDARYLACWCSTDDECHADVLLELLGEMASARHLDPAEMCTGAEVPPGGNLPRGEMSPGSDLSPGGIGSASNIEPSGEVG